MPPHQLTQRANAPILPMRTKPTPILSRHPPATSETSSDGNDGIPLQQLFAQPPMDGHDDISAATACGQPLSPSRAPAATPAGPAFQPRRLLRSAPRPAAEAAGHAGAPADSSVAVDPPPLCSQAKRSSSLPLAGTASRTVRADLGPPVELPPPPMSPLTAAGTAAPRDDPVAPYAAPSSLTALPPAGREATSSLGRVFTAPNRPGLVAQRRQLRAVDVAWVLDGPPSPPLPPTHRWAQAPGHGRRIRPSEPVGRGAIRRRPDGARNQDSVRARCSSAGEPRGRVEVAVAARSIGRRPPPASTCCTSGARARRNAT